ncbi:MAG TPA: hypothetical protein VFA53_00970 [Xanthobacteraceae bacterium]|nr:hypothetical protein [Xanthobacteraceae bacterium]
MQGQIAGAKDTSRNLRVLTLLPPSNPEYTDWFLRLMARASDQWGWVNFALARESARKDVAKVVAAERLFIRPRLLEAAAWEADPQQAAEVDRRLFEAERATRVPIGQIVAAAQSTIGRGYVFSARHRLGSSMADEVLTDNTRPFQIVRRFFAFADRMLDSGRPDLIVAMEWATALHATIWLAAAARGIPMVALRRSKIHSGRAYWTTGRLMLNDRATADAARRHQSRAAASEDARNYIEAFRTQPMVSTYVESKWSRAGKKWHQNEVVAWAKLPLKMARSAAIQAIERSRGYDVSDRPSIFERSIAPRRRAYLGRKHRKFMSHFDAATLEKMKYIYFPMHKETDLPLVFQANAWADQRHTVQLLASCVPSDCKLFVREHRANYGQRPTEYYEQLLRLPNVVLIDAFDSQFKYLRHAELIVTENGSSGWEGMLLGRKVLILSPNFYDGAGLGYRVGDPNHISEVVCDALRNPAPLDPATHDQRLAHMIDAETQNSFVNALDRVDEAMEALGGVLRDHLGASRAPTGQSLIHGAPLSPQREAAGLPVAP